VSEPAERSPGRVSRRAVIGLAAGSAAAMLVGRAAVSRRPRGRGKGPKVEILASCAACTGCVAACPVGAIEVMPGRIAVDDDRCTSCGYCMAACPVGGIVVRHRPAE
jgi:ferredoxin